MAQNQNNQRPTDSQILAQVNHTIANEQAFQGMTIIPTVNNGVVTLSGTVSNYAAKVLASNEVSDIDGVRTVLNNLDVNSSYTAPPSQPQDQQYQQQYQQPPPQESPQQGQQPQYGNQLPSQYGNQPPPQYGNQQPSQPGYQQNSGQMPPSQPYTGPSVTDTKTIILPAGTLLPVRLSDEINTATAQPNQIFHADLVSDITYDNYLLIPRGTVFVGRVISAQAAGRFAGYPELSIELTGFTLNGPDGPQKISVITDPISSQGKGRGKNTAEKAGGGALLGTIIGAIAGGGKGAAIGALSGGALGAGMNIKRGQEIDLKPEQLLQFRTNDTTVETVYLHNGQQIPPKAYTSPVLLPSSQQPPSN
ncbi:MAG: BON domain-containing protein [Acidobacteriaceae bacterium]